MACKTLSGLLVARSRLDPAELAKVAKNDGTLNDYFWKYQGWDADSGKQMKVVAKEGVVNDLSTRLAGQPGFDNTKTFTQAVNGELVDYTQAKRKANDMLTAWTKTTYHDLDSEGTQRAARLAFNLDDARQVAPETDAALDDRLSRNGLLSLDDRTRLLRAQYAATQDALGKAGIGSDGYVTLYRGVTLPANNLPLTMKDIPIGGTKEVQFQSNPLSSWSLNPDIANDFAGSLANKQGVRGFMLRAVVPRSRIVSTAGTGMGSADEFEATVMDTPGTVEAFRVWAGEDERPDTDYTTRLNNYTEHA